MTTHPVVVIGGGISGLTAAYRLWKAGQPVVLFEASSRYGGNIRTESHDGFLYDVGADSFLKSKPQVLELGKELGFESEWIQPRSDGGQVFVAKDGALRPMPEGLALGVPTRLGALLDTPLLSDVGKARACLEPFIPPRRARGEENVLDFMTRRLGREMAEAVAAPLLAGISAGDAKRLSIDAAFPQMVAWEREYGSLFAGMTGGKKFKAIFRPQRRHGSPFVSLRLGLSQFIDRLVASLPESILQKNAKVESVRVRSGQQGAFVSVGGEEIEASHVIIAGAPWLASRVLHTVSEELASVLAEVRGSPTATVFFGLEQAQVDHSLNGSGFIVPPGEGEILAGTWISSKWEGRAPEGAALVRAFLGGARSDTVPVLETSDEELVRIAWRELSRLMGRLGQARFARVYRYERGTPQLELGHQGRVERIRELAGGLPWLSLVGSGYAGIGIPDCVRGANEAVEALLAESGSPGAA